MKKKATDNARVQTNTIPDSVCTIDIQPITVAQLWDNYVTDHPVNDPTYSNQCAIRMSYTLHKVGVK